jgi:hypothetical protein
MQAQIRSAYRNTYKQNLVKRIGLDDAEIRKRPKEMDPYSGAGVS